MRRRIFVVLIALLMSVSFVYAESSFVFAKNVTEGLSLSIAQEPKGEWESLGTCRVTEYCASCNSPYGHVASTGEYLTYGHVACSWLPMYSHILINGEEFVVVDVCGTDAIDIFLDGGEDHCICDSNYYTEVYIWKE